MNINLKYEKRNLWNKVIYITHLVIQMWDVMVVTCGTK